MTAANPDSTGSSHAQRMHASFGTWLLLTGDHHRVLRFRGIFPPGQVWHAENVAAHLNHKYGVTIHAQPTVDGPLFSHEVDVPPQHANSFMKELRQQNIAIVNMNETPGKTWAEKIKHVFNSGKSPA